MTEQQRPDRCETCRFWDNPREGTNPTKEFNHLVGSCCRFPPVYVPISPQTEDDEPHDDVLLWANPVTDRNNWCGEWQAPDWADSVRSIPAMTQEEIRAALLGKPIIATRDDRQDLPDNGDDI